MISTDYDKMFVFKLGINRLLDQANIWKELLRSTSCKKEMVHFILIGDRYPTEWERYNTYCGLWASWHSEKGWTSPICVPAWNTTVALHLGTLNMKVYIICTLQPVIPFQKAGDIYMTCIFLLVISVISPPRHHILPHVRPLPAIKPISGKYMKHTNCDKGMFQNLLIIWPLNL